MHRIDGAGATVTGQWTSGDPSTGTPATLFTADFMNAVQNEIENVIVTGAGIALNKASNSQLLLAVQTVGALISGGLTPSAQAGASHTYVVGNRGAVVSRSHGSAMTDTLPGTSPGVMASGWNVVILNNSSQTLDISPGSGALINGSASAVSVPANTAKRFFSNGTNYFTVA
jgi:hypothetical protein